MYTALHENKEAYTYFFEVGTGYGDLVWVIWQQIY